MQSSAKQCPSHKLRFCLRRRTPVAHTRAALRLSVLAWSSRARRTHSAWLFLAFNSVLKCEDPSLRAAAWADQCLLRAKRRRPAGPTGESAAAVGIFRRRVRRLRLCAPTALRCAVVLERRDALCRPALLPGPAVMHGIPSSSCGEAAEEIEAHSRVLPVTCAQGRRRLSVGQGHWACRTKIESSR